MIEQTCITDNGTFCTGWEYSGGFPFLFFVIAMLVLWLMVVKNVVKLIMKLT